MQSDSSDGGPQKTEVLKSVPLVSNISHGGSSIYLRNKGKTDPIVGQREDWPHFEAQSMMLSVLHPPICLLNF